MIVVYGGSQVDEPSAPERFPEGAVAPTAARLRTLLGHLKPRVIVGAAASGADLLFVEAGLREGAHVEIVLPFPTDVFKATSVSPRGPEWNERYERALNTPGVSVTSFDEDPDADDVYKQHNVSLLAHAESLRDGDEEVWTVTVRRAGSVGTVTDHLVDSAADRGLLTLDLDPLPATRTTLFVAMPFGRKFDPVTRRRVDCDELFRKIYVPVLEDLDLIWSRADLETDSGIIHISMIDALITSDIVLADLSASNPNVAYEAGLRHAAVPASTLLIAPVLVPSQNSQAAPFDVAPIRQVRFERSITLTESQARVAVERLRRFVKTALDSRDAIDSPVHEWFVQSPSGQWRRRSVGLAETIERQIRGDVAIALRSSDPNQMIETGRALREADIDPNLALNLEIQLAYGLYAEGQYAALLELIDDRRPAPESPLLLQWLQLTAMSQRRVGEDIARQGGVPDGRFQVAQQRLTEALDLFGDTSETCGVAAGLAKRRFLAALRRGDRLTASGHLARMQTLYSRGWTVEPNSYMGINLVAALRVQAQYFGGGPEAIEQVHELLPVARFFAVREVAARPDDFYALSGLGDLEVHEAMLAAGAERIVLLERAIARYAEASTLLPSPDARRAAGDQLDFLEACGDTASVLDALRTALRG